MPAAAPIGGGAPGAESRNRTANGTRRSYHALRTYDGAGMAFDLNERASGVLLHPTSLPGAYGCGELGFEAHAFARWLRDADQRFWQMLPVGPVGYGNSPYSALSAFAGNPLLISLDRLVDEALLPRSALASAKAFPPGRVDYAAARAFREEQLHTAFAAFARRSSDHAQFEVFCAANAAWLDDFALYAAIKRARSERPWTEWEPDLRARDPSALDRARHALREEIRQQRFEQFLFARHWQALHDECRMLGLALVGDLPIFVAHDSADVWAHPDLFFLDPQGRPTVVAGVPPDYFSATGQRWGNPLYDWEKLARTGYRWWLQRFAQTFARFDAVRLDHFIGFTRYWEIPADEPTAAERALEARARREDLRVAGPRRAHRRRPGCRHAGGHRAARPLPLPRHQALAVRLRHRPAGAHLPAPQLRAQRGGVYRHARQRHHPGLVRRSWRQGERASALRYLGASGREIHWEMMRAVWASVANLAIAPVQDLLGLGSEARMNLPGTSERNWEWRLETLPGPEVQARLRELTATYGRSAR